MITGRDAVLHIGDKKVEVEFEMEMTDLGKQTFEEIEGANYERNKMETRRVLVTGIPRSGTTWVGAALSGCREVVFVDEPDDERRFAITHRAKMGLGRYPIIAPGDETTVGGYGIIRYREMWDAAWNVGNEFAPKNVVLKSALIPYCMEWVVENFHVDAVVWCDRFPLNTMASWVEYAKAAHPDEPLDVLIKRMCWQYGMLHETYTRLYQLGVITARVKHEELSADFTLFEKLACDVGLEWTYRSAEWLNDMNQEGEGGHWGLEDYKRDGHLHRQAHKQKVDRWKQRLEENEVLAIVEHLQRWPSVIPELVKGHAFSQL